MIASLWNPTIQRGGTWNIDITSKDENGIDRDFSEYDSMRIHIRPAWVKQASASNTPLLTLTTENGRISINTTTITLLLTAAETATLDFNTGKYELEMIKNAVVGPPPVAEVVDKLLYGKITITGEMVI